MLNQGLHSMNGGGGGPLQLMTEVTTGYLKQRVSSEGKPCVTQVTKWEEMSVSPPWKSQKSPCLTDRMTRVELRPLTGRTHQLRAHCAAAGVPIRVDTLYGPTLEQGSHEKVSRLCLHASAITFDHPVTLRRLTLTSPCPF